MNSNLKSIIIEAKAEQLGGILWLFRVGQVVREEFHDTSDWKKLTGKVQNTNSRVNAWFFEHTGIARNNQWYGNAMMAHDKIPEGDKKRILSNPNVTKAWIIWLIHRGDEAVIHSLCKDITPTSPKMFEAPKQHTKSNAHKGASDRGDNADDKDALTISLDCNAADLENHIASFISLVSRQGRLGPTKAKDAITNGMRRTGS